MDGKEQVKVTVRANGPYRIQGPVTIVDAEGNEFKVETDREWISLCRCGLSETKPFCDGAHKRQGFQADTRAG